MILILSKSTEALTGSLGRGYGYHIQRRKNGFFAKRNSKGDVPPDGHLRFIIRCAELARIGLHIADILVTAEEFRSAISEADRFFCDRLANTPAKLLLDAREVLDYQKRYEL